MNQPARKETGATPRRKFDETYQRHAVELTLHGDRTVKAVAKELELPPWQLYEWRKLYAPRPGAAGPAPQTLEDAVQEKAVSVRPSFQLPTFPRRRDDRADLRI